MTEPSAVARAETSSDVARDVARETARREAARVALARRDAAADRAEEALSLDRVQRVVVSVLLTVVVGSIAAVLALYLAYAPETFSRNDTIALWSMTGVIGLITAAGVLVVNRRKPYSPWAALGLLPMLVSGLLIF